MRTARTSRVSQSNLVRANSYLNLTFVCRIRIGDAGSCHRSDGEEGSGVEPHLDSRRSPTEVALVTKIMLL